MSTFSRLPVFRMLLKKKRRARMRQSSLSRKSQQEFSPSKAQEPFANPGHQDISSHLHIKKLNLINRQVCKSWIKFHELLVDGRCDRLSPEFFHQRCRFGDSQKTDTDTHLKKFWNAVKSGRRNSCVEKCEIEGNPKEDPTTGIQSQVCSVLLLQVWPSQDSPKGESHEGSFVFPKEESSRYEDSGIDSVQVSPLPVSLLQTQPVEIAPSPSLSDRRPSRTLLHPDHAKLMVQRSGLQPPLDHHHPTHEGTSKLTQNGGFFTSPLSSSAASSVTSITGGPGMASHSSDPIHNCESRRSSTMTNRYSLLDALDLEYALIKAAARGSIGPYSLSQSLQKLTFTQSLAFPALARGLSNKRSSTQSNPRSPLDPLDSGVNAFAKVATVLVLVLISVLVFGVLYKFIRT